jgi:hypothetical protein
MASEQILEDDIRCDCGPLACAAGQRRHRDQVPALRSYGRDPPRRSARGRQLHRTEVVEVIASIAPERARDRIVASGTPVSAGAGRAQARAGALVDDAPGREEFLDLAAGGGLSAPAGRGRSIVDLEHRARPRHHAVAGAERIALRLDRQADVAAARRERDQRTADEPKRRATRPRSTEVRCEGERVCLGIPHRGHANPCDSARQMSVCGTRAL